MTARTPQLSTSATSYSAEATDWSSLIRHVKVLDEVGFDRVVVSDHVVYGERLEEYARPEVGGTKGGTQPTGPDGHWLEPLTTLTYLGAATSRIRLGTNILIAALRRPVVLAKTLSTMDVLTGGRIDLGVGVGWQREEYDAAGLSFDGRGRLLNHTLEVLRTLWTQQRASYASAELTFEHIHQMPKPLQPGGVPIWVSGTVNARSASRLATFGSGWIPWGEAAADPARGIAEMGRLLAEHGRDIAEIQIVGGLRVVKADDGMIDVERTVAGVAPLVAAGVTDLRVRPLPTTTEADVERLRAFVDAFRRATR